MWKVLLMWTVSTIFIMVDCGEYFRGQHVCQREEKYNVTFEQPHKINITIRDYVWCLSVPPRCSKYYTKLVDNIQVVQVERVKLVEVCCSGYEADKKARTCNPICGHCVYGDCVQPEQCSCHNGYTGNSCNETCPAGNWGPNCAEKCNCIDQVVCNPATRSCVCSVQNGSRCKHEYSSVIHNNLNNSNEDALSLSTEEKIIIFYNNTVKNSSENILLPTTNDFDSVEQPNDTLSVTVEIERPLKRNLILKIGVVIGVTAVIISLAVIISVSHRRNFICIDHHKDENHKILNKKIVLQNKIVNCNLVSDEPVYQFPRNPKNEPVSINKFNSEDFIIFTKFNENNFAGFEHYDIPVSRDNWNRMSPLNGNIDPIYDEVPANIRVRPADRRVME